MTLVSVIVATYNRPELLTKSCIPSILGQMHTNVDIHIVGDGCSEETLNKMGDLRAIFKDDRLRFTNRPRPEYPPDGLDAWHVSGSHAWNYGLDTVKGEYVCFLADDDEYHPEFIEALLDAIIENDAGLAWCASEIWGPGFRGYLGVDEPLRLGGQSGGEFLWRRNDVRFDPECYRKGLPNDWDYFSRVLASGVVPVHVKRALYKYYPTQHVPRGCDRLPW